MFGLGTSEVIVIMVIALLVFGPKKLPEIGKSLGGAMRELRKASNDFMSAVNTNDFEVDEPVEKKEGEEE
ncbi:MAG: TatA/E family twin arginine-targeting protein translocase [Armatimonadota bacterium]|nr:TatA/E family twin arginine-targeting protein translocase [Armatimonadota bacterium]